MKTTEHAYSAALASMRALRVEYLDMYLIHWPAAAKVHSQSSAHKTYRLNAWRALERLKAEERVRVIGVSNFTEHHIRELLINTAIPPAVNQVEFHPLCYQQGLKEFCGSHGICLQGYSSLGSGALLSHPAILKVSQSIGRSPAQILLRWSLQHGVPVIPKTSDPSRLTSNSALFDFALSSTVMEELNNLNLVSVNAGAEPLRCITRFCWDPSVVR